MGRWTNPTHRIWHWYFNKERDKLFHISGTTVKHFKRATGWQCTRSITTYQLTQEETSIQTFPTGIPTSVIRISDFKMNKLHEGPSPLPAPRNSHSFWEFTAMWGGNWMWNNIDAGEYPKDDMNLDFRRNNGRIPHMDH
jgi:hypothetical protein